MGAKYDWHIKKFWIEYTPWMYLRINKKTKVGWKTIFEFWV